MSGVKISINDLTVAQVINLARHEIHNKFIAEKKEKEKANAKCN